MVWADIVLNGRLTVSVFGKDSMTRVKRKDDISPMFAFSGM